MASNLNRGYKKHLLAKFSLFDNLCRLEYMINTILLDAFIYDRNELNNKIDKRNVTRNHPMRRNIATF